MLSSFLFYTLLLQDFTITFFVSVSGSFLSFQVLAVSSSVRCYYYYFLLCVFRPRYAQMLAISLRQRRGLLGLARQLELRRIHLVAVGPDATRPHGRLCRHHTLDTCIDCHIYRSLHTTLWAMVWYACCLWTADTYHDTMVQGTGPVVQSVG